MSEKRNPLGCPHTEYYDHETGKGELLRWPPGDARVEGRMALLCLASVILSFITTTYRVMQRDA